DPHRLKAGELVSRAAPPRPSNQKLAQLAADVLGAKPSFPRGEQVIAGFIQGRFASVDEKGRSSHGGGVQLAFLGTVGAYGIDVRPRRDPLSLDDRLGGGRRGDNQICVANSLLGAFDRLDSEGEPRRHLVGKAASFFEVKAG